MHNIEKIKTKIIYDYIAIREPTIKKNTCSTLGSTLSGFHRWLAHKKIALHTLNRDHMTRWFSFLSTEGFHPSTRRYKIMSVRQYLSWLYEKGMITISPEELIRKGDFPKLPSYLPRPLPPEVDFELQNRLANSENQLHQGLLLMRKTGVRISELMGLEYDCIRRDHNGIHFIKVPLGKLYNERLVPLEEATVKLIHKIQNKGPMPRTFLLFNECGKQPSYNELKKELYKLCEGIETTKPITSHRLRHTFATSLLNGGMSLVGVMKLLGHRDIRMTLRYASVTQETVVKQYFEALKRVQFKYHTEFKCHIPSSKDFDPIDAVGQVISWLENSRDSHPIHQRRIHVLSRRLHRAKKDLEQLKRAIEKERDTFLVKMAG